MLLALFLAGLGFFFTGLDGIRNNVKQMTSRRFRAALQRLTRNPALAAIWGMVFGALSQSASAVAFILVGMITSGLMDLRRALLVVTWANLGTVLLVFIAAVDINLAIYALVGVTSLFITFRILRQHQVAVRVLYGVGLLFLGLKLMKEGTVPISEYPWFQSGMTLFQGSAITAFLLGALLRFVIQSSSVIVVIAVQLAAAGLLGESDVRLIMHGTAVGVGLSILMLSARFSGLPRQIATHQALINGTAGLSLAGLFLLERAFGGGLLTRALTDPRLGSTEFRMAVGFLAQQSLVVALGTALGPIAPRVLARLCPPTPVERMASPRYIRDARIDDPGTALVLAEKEQARVLAMVPLMLDARRDGGGEGAGIPVEELREAARSLHVELAGFLADLLDQELDRTTSRQLLEVEQRQRTIHSLAEAVAEFARSLPTGPRSTYAAELVTDLTESLHALLSMAGQAAETGDRTMSAMLRQMTYERGDLKEKIRARFVSAPDAMDTREKSTLFHLTTLFERCVWMVNQLVSEGAASEDERVARPVAAAAPIGPAAAAGLSQVEG
jgi:phosphate:Na+ symporter